MVQEQLVDYINTQMKLGISRDAVKAALIGAGWQTADVEDTLKKIEGAKIASPAAAVSPAAITFPAAGATASVASAMPASKPTTTFPATNTSQPQTIKVSDLISSAPASVSTSPSMPSKSPMTGTTVTKPSISTVTTAQSSTFSASKPRGSHTSLITEIVMVVVIIAVGAFAGFLYMQNSTLNTQLNSLNGQSTSVTSQLSSLQAAVAASTTALTAQVSSLTNETQEMQTELSFYVAPSVAGATSTATISGTVSGGGKSLYEITAMHGAKIFVVNSKTASVIAALTPLMATASTTASSAQFTGVYVPGSESITLTAVNGIGL